MAVASVNKPPAPKAPPPNAPADDKKEKAAAPPPPPPPPPAADPKTTKVAVEGKTTALTGSANTSLLASKPSNEPPKDPAKPSAAPSAEDSKTKTLSVDGKNAPLTTSVDQLKDSKLLAAPKDSTPSPSPTDSKTKTLSLDGKDAPLTASVEQLKDSKLLAAPKDPATASPSPADSKTKTVSLDGKDAPLTASVEQLKDSKLPAASKDPATPSPSLADSKTKTLSLDGKDAPLTASVDQLKDSKLLDAVPKDLTSVGLLGADSKTKTTTLSPDGKNPLPMDATTNSLAASKAADGSEESPKYISYDALKKPEKATAESPASTRAEVLGHVGRAIASVQSLEMNTRSMTAALVGQDLPHVQPEDDVNSFASKARDFLLEVQSDTQKMAGLAKEQVRLTDQYYVEGSDLHDAQKKAGWNDAKLKEEGPSEMGELTLARENLDKSTTLLADASAAYNKNVEAKALEFMNAWDKTEKAQAKKETMATLNAVVDLFTAMGIGGNAIAQLATKELKNPFKTISEAGNAAFLRPGQVGDMIQAGWNSGISLKNLQAKSLPGVIDEIDAGAGKVGSAMTKLAERLRDYVSYQEAQRYEGLTGW